MCWYLLVSHGHQTIIAVLESSFASMALKSRRLNFSLWLPRLSMSMLHLGPRVSDPPQRRGQPSSFREADLHFEKVLPMEYPYPTHLLCQTIALHKKTKLLLSRWWDPRCRNILWVFHRLAPPTSTSHDLYGPFAPYIQDLHLLASLGPYCMYWLSGFV